MEGKIDQILKNQLVIFECLETQKCSQYFGITEMLIKAQRETNRLLKEKGGKYQGFDKWAENEGKELINSYEKLKKERDELREMLPEIIRRYWKFDEWQHPSSSWHDREDLINEIETL